MMNLSADSIRNHARGRWLFILSNLAPELEQAVSKPGKRHIGCPIHGGRDGFRLFKDADSSGGGICNTCGAKTDGFSLLMWLRGWSFPDALAAVANTLGINEGGVDSRLIQQKNVVQTAFKSDQNDVRIKKICVILGWSHFPWMIQGRSPPGFTWDRVGWIIPLSIIQPLDFILI